MKVAVFSAKDYDQDGFSRFGGAHEYRYTKDRLTRQSAIFAKGAEAVCVFVNDEVDAEVLARLSDFGVRFLVLRCAGFNNVDLNAASELGIRVARVPAYSPHAVAEHAVALLLTLNRKTHRAYNRVREGNFALSGLVGFDLVGKTVGVFGAGKIGGAFIRIMLGFGCRVLVYDPGVKGSSLPEGSTLVEKAEIFRECDIVSLHCPLTDQTYHLYDDEAFSASKPGVVLINTGRGGLVNAKAAIAALKTGLLGGLAIDVYEEEKDVFYEDRSSGILQDDVLARLMTFPNTLITGHQGFFTKEALQAIAETTVRNLDDFAAGNCCDSELR